MPFSTPFEEHEESPKETGDRSGKLQFTRIFTTDWDQRWQFLSELYTSGPFGLPASYSSYWPGVVADTFDIVPLVVDPQPASITNPNYENLRHRKAKITVNYTPLASDQLSQDPQGTPLPDGTWGTYTQEQTVEFRSLPGRSCKWESDDQKLPDDVHPSVPDMLTTHTVTWNQVTRVPWVTLGNLKGKVNLTACRLPGSQQTFRAGTLLFEGLTDDATLSFVTQQQTRKLVLKFVEKAQHALAADTRGGAAPEGSGTVYGWNYQWRDDTGTYDKPVSDTGETLFAEGNFNEIWTATT